VSKRFYENSTETILENKFELENEKLMNHAKLNFSYEKIELL
jgi:hypothetical protein